MFKLHRQGSYSEDVHTFILVIRVMGPSSRSLGPSKKIILLRGHGVLQRHCVVRGRVVEPRNHKVPSWIPGRGFSLAHSFGTSTGVVPRKQNLERLV